MRGTTPAAKFSVPRAPPDFWPPFSRQERREQAPRITEDVDFDIIKKPEESATTSSKDVFARLESGEIAHYVNIYRRYIAADFENGASTLPVMTLPVRDKHGAEATVRWGPERRRLAVMPHVEEAWMRSASQLDLLAWLHARDGQVTLPNGKAVDLSTEPALRYLESQAEREPYRVIFGTGNRVIQASPDGGKSKPLPAGSYMIVVGLDGLVYMAKEKRKEFNHASIFAAEEVLGAGEALINSAGQLLTAAAVGDASCTSADQVGAEDNSAPVELNNRSGHYRPQAAHTIQFLYLLQRNGLDLSNVTLLVFRKRGQNGSVRGRFMEAEIKTEHSPRSSIRIGKNRSPSVSALTPQQVIEVVASITLESPEPAIVRKFWKNHPLS